MLDFHNTSVNFVTDGMTNRGREFRIPGPRQVRTCTETAQNLRELSSKPLKHIRLFLDGADRLRLEASLELV
jgi:hypothetical protein